MGRRTDGWTNSDSYILLKKRIFRGYSQPDWKTVVSSSSILTAVLIAIDHFSFIHKKTTSLVCRHSIV